MLFVLVEVLADSRLGVSLRARKASFMRFWPTFVPRFPQNVLPEKCVFHKINETAKKQQQILPLTRESGYGLHCTNSRDSVMDCAHYGC